jgi:BASS family bile acid:Na+ symporter
MNELLTSLTQVAMLAFLVAGMLELGLSLTFREVLAPLRNLRLVALAVLANFIVAPLLAIGIARLVRLEEPYVIGLLLLGLAPGAPFIPKIVQVAHGDVAFAVGLMALLMVGTVVALALGLPLIVKGTEVSAWKIAQPLLLLMLMPLAIGLLVRVKVPALPGWWRPSLSRLANLSGLVVLVLLVALNVESVWRMLGNGSILAAVLFVALSLLIGWMIGGRDRGVRSSLALGTGSRNFAAALLVGSQNFKDPKVNVMVIVTAIISMAILLPAAVRFGRANAGGATSAVSVPPSID